MVVADCMSVLVGFHFVQQIMAANNKVKGGICKNLRVKVFGGVDNIYDVLSTPPKPPLAVPAASTGIEIPSQEPEEAAAEPPSPPDLSTSSTDGHHESKFSQRRKALKRTNDAKKQDGVGTDHGVVAAITTDPDAMGNNGVGGVVEGVDDTDILMGEEGELSVQEIEFGRFWRDKLLNGVWVKKHYNTAPMLAPRMRVLWLTDDSEMLMMSKKVGDKADGKGLGVEGIQELVVGPTPYSESINNEAISARCFSIIGADRVFHMELPTEQSMEQSVEGMEAFINAHQANVL